MSEERADIIRSHMLSEVYHSKGFREAIAEAVLAKAQSLTTTP